MISRFLFRSVSMLVLAALALGMARPSEAQTNVFTDEFDSGSLSSSWNVYGTDRYLSRTQFGNLPTFATEGTTKYMRLRLDTYNAQYPGSYLTGTEMHTKTQFAVGGGVQVEYRVRAPQLPPGVVWAFFMLGERGVWPYSYARDEIDYENLSTLGNGRSWTNIFNDTNPNTGTGSDSAMVSSTPGADAGKWMIYKIRWFSDRVEWWFNTGVGGSDILVRTETNSALVCDDTQSIRLNIWASDSSWTEAYGDLPVTANKATNTAYYFDVDYVRMTSIGGRGSVGTGDGLKAEYFDNADFTAPIKTRVDPKVNFDWSYNSALDGMGAESFSIRWSGQVQALLTENYTFYARADDGVRLWVNGRLLIDQWKSQGATEYSGTIALTAGQKYAIKMEYFDDDYAALAQLRWSSPSTTKSIVPKCQLYSLYTPPADSTSPVVKITTPAASSTYPSLSQASGTATDNADVIYVTARLYRYSDNTYWTGYTWGPYSTEVSASKTNNWQNWTFSFPSLANGKYSLRASARDAADNIGYSPVNIFTVGPSADTTAPLAKITSPVHASSYSSLSQATGTASDAGGVANAQVRLSRVINSVTTYWNGTSWTSTAVELAASGTTNWTYAMPTLASGTYSLRAGARDTAGNIGYSPVVNFTVGAAASDTTAPTAAITSPAHNGTFTSLSQATGTASDAGGIANVYVRLYRFSDGRTWNGAAWTTADYQYLASGTTNWSAAIPSLIKSKYSLRARAVDKAGNSGLSSIVEFTIGSADTTVPTAAITSPAHNGTFASLSQATGTASDASGIASVYVRLYRFSDGRVWNGGAWTTRDTTEFLANGTTNWSAAIPSLIKSKYSLRARAVDAAGNSGSSSTVEFTIGENSSPIVSILEPKQDAGYSSLPSANGTASDANGIANVRGVLRRGNDGQYWSGNGWVDAWTEVLANGTTNWAFTMPALPSGYYTFWAVARDSLGNATTTAGVNFYVP